ncbi:MAG: rod shape-determining protein MreD [Rhodospirillaceae bacterium TMED8]|nr:rod shape-determining protein MreD [Magnetovibrio sp.]OUT48930.1 MAG: rod shape-determining protein MreD [Rhodospirillaceae bacterium TMED8]|tara:strand:- start:3398 stop:3913 length:516 start_codon:yes stop_codon:yes gene_type:complete
MRRTIWNRLDALGREMTPFFFGILLILFSVIIFQMPSWARVAPLFSLMVIYHWTVYRPDLMPGYAVFLIGLLQDVFCGTPLGVITLVYITVYGILIFQQRYLTGRTFFVVWLGFVLLSALTMMLIWLAVSALGGGISDLNAMLHQFLLSAGFYPLLARLFLIWQIKILRPV